MSKLVKLNGRPIPTDVLDWILDYFWTGSESLDDVELTYIKYGEDNSYNYLQWKNLCSLSRSSHLLRSLCLPRMTGTLYFEKCKTIGQFWKAVQLNPSRGSSTHTCCFKFRSSVWPTALTPSQGIEKMFKEGVRETALAEAMEKDPNGDYTIKTIKSYPRIGPDGTGFDGNITNPEEFRQALVDIVHSWTRIKSLHWETEGVPLLTGIIEHVESLGTLDSLSICVAACEERCYLSDKLSVFEKSKVCTPLWRLTQQISHLEICNFGFSGYGGGWPLDLDEEILNPQLDTLEEALQSASKRLETLFLDMFYHHESHSHSRFKDFVRKVLPKTSCISNIRLPEYMDSLTEHHLHAMRALHPALKTLAIQKHRLETSDIQALGKKASEEEGHPLAPYSHLLQEEGVAESISKEWNEKYAPS